MNLGDYFSEKKDQRAGKIPSDADMKRFMRIKKLLDKGGDEARTVSKKDKEFYDSLMKKMDTTGGRTVSDQDAQNKMDGGMVMPKKKKKAKAKKMMGGGKVYSRGSRKANYNV